jgi:hypothetical protein
MERDVMRDGRVAATLGRAEASEEMMMYHCTTAAA